MRWMVCLYCGMLLRRTVGAGACRGGGTVRVDANMATNLSGCFACGDLAGKPYQYIKAAGQGNVAALSAVEWLAKQKK